MENGSVNLEQFGDLGPKNRKETLLQAPEIVILTGPTGVGKSSVFKELFARFPDFGQIGAYTDRLARGPNESKTIVTADEFSAMKARDMFALSYSLYGYNYGDTREEVERAFNTYQRLLLSYPIAYIQDLVNLSRAKNKVTTTICLLPPNIDTIKQRLSSRPERIQYALQELDLLNTPQIQKYIDHFVVNDDLDNTINFISDIICGKIPKE